MRTRPLGQSGIEASVVGFGAWAIGGWMWGGTDEEASVGAVRAALDAGVNLIDTAPAYGFGRSEQIIARAIRGRRDRVVLATKCGLAWHTPKGQVFFAADEKGIHEQGPIKVRRHLGPDSIRYEVEQSLLRLQTDRIDLYQIHWQDPGTPIEDTMACLLRLKQEGKIRAVGVCNAGVGDLERYRRIGPLDADQERYSMLDRKMERDQIPYAARHGMATLAYSPLEHGLLTGRIGTERTFGEGDLRRKNPLFQPVALMRTRVLLDRLAPIARRRGASLTQLAIAWAIAEGGCTHALAGARTPEQARENAAAAELALSREERAEINGLLSEYAAGAPA